MSIATRLGLGFGALVLLIILFGLVAMVQMDRLKTQTQDLYDHPFTVTLSVDEAEIEIHKIHLLMNEVARTTDSGELLTLQDRIDTHEDKALQQLKVVGEQYLGDSQQVSNVIDALIDWRTVRAEVFRLRLAGKLNSAADVVGDIGSAEVAQLEQNLGELQQFARSKASGALAEARIILHQSELIIGLTCVMAVLLGIGIAVLITQSIRKPLNRLDHAATEVSHGDLNQQVEIISRDELGRLSSTFNFMVTSIREQTEEIRKKNEENERLLLNVLPGPIADRLKAGEEPIADYFPEVTVLFADIVGFTQLSERVDPDELVSMLNHLFSRFDEAARDLEIEKIKTIGDCYMAVAGLTTHTENPPVSMIEMASEILSAIDVMNQEFGTSLQVRVGINCGPVIAGVIGKSKFIYDLWGDTVNLASRMESHGLAGRIHVTEAVYEQVKGQFELEGRGLINIKGKGEIETYLIHAESDN